MPVSIFIVAFLSGCAASRVYTNSRLGGEGKVAAWLYALLIVLVAILVCLTVAAWDIGSIS